eukprot:6916123-Prorocentrum_lima.AAC.1
MLPEPQERWGRNIEPGEMTEAVPRMTADAPEFKPSAEIARGALIQRIKRSKGASEPTVNQVLDPNMATAN